MILSQKVLNIIWVVLLLVMPISSFTPLSQLMGGTNVAPLALIPSVIILLFYWFPALFKGGKKLPYQVKPLYLFFLVGCLSSLLIFLRNVPSFQGFNLNRSVLETLVTFAIGTSFYLVTIFMVTDENKLRSTIRWISIAGIILMAYSWLQVATWIIFRHYPEWMFTLNWYISASGKLFEHRASGLTFEPSWLAHELNILFIPLWLGLSISGQSVFKRKFFDRIQVERALFVFSLATMFITFSRIGWITVILLVTYVIFRSTNTWVKKKTASLNDMSVLDRRRQRLLRFGIWSGLLIGLFAVTLIAGVIMTKIEPRMAGLFDFQRLVDRGFLEWAAKLSMAERFTYWMAFYGVFQLFPVIGAGFGVPGFFFQQTVSDYGSQLLDINELILTKSYLPNAKNLWVRLLSETGIIGFSLFVSWIMIHWRNASELDKLSEAGLLKAMGSVGKLILLAMIFEGFSLDTFGLPYYWIGLGLIVASWRAKSEYQDGKPKRKSA